MPRGEYKAAVLQDPDHGAARWLPDGRAWAFVDVRSGVDNLWAFPETNPPGEPKQLTHYTKGVIWDLRWSPDGKKIALARGTNTSDVVLFRAAK